MERISQRQHYDYDFVRCKGYLKSISDRWEKSNFRRGTYPQIFLFVQYTFFINLLL